MTILQNNLIDRSLNHVWHPGSQMKDFLNFPPLVIESAQGSFLYTKDKKRVIDGISSWWCKSLGHGHPRIKAAIQHQMDKFEHVILAHTTHELIVELSENLSCLLPGLNKMMYASDGSCAIEIALKMALHAKQIQGHTHKTQFMALKNSYHGETGLALSVSDLGVFRKPYEPILIQSHFIAEIPYVNSMYEPLWHNCETAWHTIETQLEPYKDNLCALIVEPILQGSGGMQLYSQDFLRRLRTWAQKNSIYFIADEILTGFGRTGLPLACQHAGITPDFICLGKGLTAGFLPLSVMLTTSEIYHLFYDDYEAKKAFVHSHTHTGNALALAAALETYKVMEEEHIYAKLPILESELYKGMQYIAEVTQRLTNLRGIGGVVAADFVVPNHAAMTRLGFKVAQKAIQLGALLRPIGNTLYWLPPFTIELETLATLRDITLQAIQETYHELGL